MRELDPAPERPIPPKRDRSFTIGDAMKLVAALAVGLEIYRRIRPLLGVTDRALGSPRSDALLTRIEHTTAAILIPMTLACLTIRLGRPRPPFRQIAREPGFVATGLASCLLALDAATSSPGILLFDHNLSMYLSQWIYAAIGHCGVAVGGAWCGLAAGSCWPPGPGWTDRLGTSIGACWILLALSPIYHQILQLLQIFQLL